jgi:hypothetical protein
MFQQLLFVHWKGARFGLLPFVLMAFGLPLLVIQGLTSNSADPEMVSPIAVHMLHVFQIWAPLFPLLAALTGIVLALSAWSWDHKGDHVYPLSLPLARWRYVLMKMGTGVVLLVLPCFAFWLGALLATSFLDIPEGLRAYPSAVAVRFLITALLLYALLFAMAAGTPRTTIWVLLAFVVLLVSAGFVADFLGGTVLPGFQSSMLLEWLLDRLLNWPGPFEVITGSWMLVDV